MPAVTSTIPSRNATDAPAKAGSLAQSVIDRRRKEWRRRGELIAIFTRAVGESVTEVLTAKIERAAEMATIAEAARARYLGGEAISLDDVVRVERAASLAEKALGIGKRAEPKPSLANYLASKGRAA